MGRFLAPSVKQPLFPGCTVAVWTASTSWVSRGLRAQSPGLLSPSTYQGSWASVQRGVITACFCILYFLPSSAYATYPVSYTDPPYPFRLLWSSPQGHSWCVLMKFSVPKACFQHKCFLADAEVLLLDVKGWTMTLMCSCCILLILLKADRSFWPGNANLYINIFQRTYTFSKMPHLSWQPLQLISPLSWLNRTGKFPKKEQLNLGTWGKHREEVDHWGESKPRGSLLYHIESAFGSRVYPKLTGSEHAVSFPLNTVSKDSASLTMRTSEQVLKPLTAAETSLLL